MRKKLIPYHLVTFPSPMTRKQAPGKRIFKQNIQSYSDATYLRLTLYF